MIRRIGTICILLALLAAPVTAQATTDPLLGLLARVPDGAMRGGSLVSYVDYRAVEQARPAAARPGSTAGWWEPHPGDAVEPALPAPRHHGPVTGHALARPVEDPARRGVGVARGPGPSPRRGSQRT
jgi:hypothetical protein